MTKNDSTQTTIRLNSCGLKSKWGFDDGDVDLGRYDDLQKNIIPMDRHLPFHHELLARTVEKYLLPKLPSGIKTYRIGTCHNPIRLENDSPSDFEDVEVEIPLSDIRAIAEEISREWSTP